MSAAEPVSAFGAFRSAKEMTDNKKNKNKKQTNSKNTKGKQTGKAGTNGAKEKANPKNVNKNKIKNNEAGPKKTNGNTKAKATSNKHFKDSEVVGLVEELMGDPSKKLSKAQLKKKQDLEQYLVEQLEKDDQVGMRGGGRVDEEFDSESELGSDEYSGEYTIDESGSDSASGSESESESESGSDMDDDSFTDGGATQNSSGDSGEPSPIAAKNNKRKLASGDMGTTNKSTPLQNGDLESKKAKSLCMRKSLPAQTKDVSKMVKDNKKQKRNSLDLGNTKQDSGKITVKLEPLSPPKNITKVHSIEEGKRAFQWLINPIKVDEFFSKYWENKSCLIRRQQKSYFSHLISFEAIDQMLLQNHVEFTKNIDVTSYKNGIRETLNPEGRALPPVMWDHYGQGCSIRLLNPQTFLPNLYSLSSTMQEYFHCLVGANAYLTPPNSQGFAPHYDDIEAFVLQIEGRKRWKLYKPRNSSEVLPRYSSRNFDQKEIGKPILEEVLEPGDVLYFPRGTIHQACTEPGYHSLHLTLSVYQKQSFADLFEKMMPLMVKKAIESNVELRRGLPLYTWQNAGLAFSDISSKERNDFQQKVTKLMQKCLKEMPLMDIVDAAVDQCAKKFQHEALPPEVLSGEKLRTIFGSRSRTNERGECICDYDIDERTNVRLLRANILRLVEEDDKIRLYYYLDNSKEYCEYEPNFIEIESLEAASIEILIKSYPSYVGVSQLPLSSDEKKITLVTALWERGLLMMEKPFK